MTLRADWSPSRLRTAMHCERRHRYEYGLHGEGAWKPRGNHKTEGGNFLHDGLAKFDHLRALGAAKQEATEAAVKHVLLTTAGWQSDSTKMNRRNIVRAVQWYCDDQPENAKEGLVAALDENGAPMIECVLEHKLAVFAPDGGVQRRLVVKFDLLGTLAGVPVMVERKTTEGGIGPEMAARYSPDVQIDAEDLVVNTQNGPWKGAQLVIEAHQVGVGFSRWYRWAVNRTEDQRAEALGNITHRIGEVEGHMVEHQAPMNTACCGMYNPGNDSYGCPWRPVCAREPGLREEFIETGVDKEGKAYYVKK